MTLSKVKVKKQKLLPATASLSERDQAVADAIESIKKGGYKGTAIKVELEAQLGRRQDYEGSYDTCEECDEGERYNDDEDEYETCEACDGSGRLYEQGQTPRPNFARESVCEDFIRNAVSDKAKQALIFGKFYNDGSVDSEFTFTVPIDQPHIVLEYIEAFTKLAKAINPNSKEPLNTQGAGMHLAILNSARGSYPTGCKLISTRAQNFAKTMSHLIPALYFLASVDHQSRTLRFRQPQISLRDKYSIIAGRNGVLEFRCFETCYQKPEAFLDFFCVMAKCLQFYTTKAVELDFFGSVGEIGIKDGYGIDRFFYTVKHLEALEKGVAVIKPDYKTFEQLKKERNFKITKSKLAIVERKMESRWKQEFTEFKDRFEHTLETHKEYLLRQWNSSYNSPYSDVRTESALERQLGIKRDKWIERELEVYKRDHAMPDTPETYVESKKSAYSRDNVQFVVTV